MNVEAQAVAGVEGEGEGGGGMKMTTNMGFLTAFWTVGWSVSNNFNIYIPPPPADTIVWDEIGHYLFPLPPHPFGVYLCPFEGLGGGEVSRK